MIKKALYLFLSLSMLCSLFVSSVSAEVLTAPEQPSQSYVYDYYRNAVPVPDPYTIQTVVDGVKLGLGNFKKVNDLFAAKDGSIYLLTSGDTAEDNRVIKFDRQLAILQVYHGYKKNGMETPFTEPLGIFVTDEGDLYIADGTTKEILHMDSACNLKRVIAAPTEKDSSIIDSTFKEKYRPSKLVVDPSGRIHVVAVNINQGIVEFDPDGKFEGFLAAGKVNANALDILWRKISTEAQKNRMRDYVPIEYNNIALDAEGFLFATAAAIDESVVLAEIRSGAGSEQGALVRRLNMLGGDILRRKGFFPPVGDIHTSNLNPDALYKGISKITDVSCGDYGTYTLLDNNRNHIFTYDSEGYLLYAFSGPDVTAGGFRTPLSVVQAGEYLYVLDGGTRSVTMMKMTDFAKTIRAAIGSEKNGDYEKAASYWQEVLKLNAEYELAYMGLGKYQYQLNNFEEAMRLFKISNNRDWYSKAYAEYRKNIIAKYFAPVSLVVGSLAVAFIVAGAIQKKKRKREGERGI